MRKMAPTNFKKSSSLKSLKQRSQKSNVRQGTLQKFLKISIKNSKCAISNKHIQDGRPGRYENRRGSKNKGRTEPDPARERTARHKSIPEIAVRCHHPRKTSQITAKPEEWPKRWRNSEVCIVCMCHRASPRRADTDA